MFKYIWELSFQKHNLQVNITTPLDPSPVFCCCWFKEHRNSLVEVGSRTADGIGIELHWKRGGSRRWEGITPFWVNDNTVNHWMNHTSLCPLSPLSLNSFSLRLSHLHIIPSAFSSPLLVSESVPDPQTDFLTWALSNKIPGDIFYRCAFDWHELCMCVNDCQLCM